MDFYTVMMNQPKLNEHITITRLMLGSFAPTNIRPSLRKPDPGPLRLSPDLVGSAPCCLHSPSPGSLTTPLADPADITIGCVKEPPPNQRTKMGRYLLKHPSIILSLTESSS